MEIDLSAFVFSAGSLRANSEKDFIARIPANIRNCETLFDCLRRELALPSYFGNNWNALVDCLGTLSWIDRHRVLILHDDLPKIGLEDTRIYLEVLSSAALDWKRGEEHELIVAFPQSVAKDIADLAGAADS
jgi:RNAse (barnase) inhibitor barstar